MTFHSLARWLVTYESRVGRQSSRVQVCVLGGKLLGAEVSVLAAQVTSLAGLGGARVARHGLAVVVRVQVSTSGSAVAVGRDRLSMNVVHERAASGWETGKVNAKLDTLAVGSGGTLNGTREGASRLLRKRSNVLCADGVVCYYGGVGRLSGDGRSRGQDGDDGDKHLDCMCMYGTAIW